jgi:hypothetical protein
MQRSNYSFLRRPPFPHNYALLFVIPSVPGFPTSLLSTTTTDVVLIEENHMHSTEDATLDRKSGAAEGPAVRHSCAPPLPAKDLLLRDHQDKPALICDASDLRRH